MSTGKHNRLGKTLSYIQKWLQASTDFKLKFFQFFKFFFNLESSLTGLNLLYSIIDVSVTYIPRYVTGWCGVGMGLNPFLFEFIKLIAIYSYNW